MKQLCEYLIGILTKPGNHTRRNYRGLQLSKIYRLTLGFDPISNVDVESENLPDALKKVIQWLKDNGNDVDDSIVLSGELISTVNPLDIAPKEEEETNED